MTSMIERMAEALWMSNKPEGAPDFNELSNVDKFQVELIARDVLKSMKDPTEAMLSATYKDEDGKTVWSAMIDAALKEGED